MKFTESWQDRSRPGFHFTDWTDQVMSPRTTCARQVSRAAGNRIRPELACVKSPSIKRKVKCLTESKRGVALGCQKLGPGEDLGTGGCPLSLLPIPPQLSCCAQWLSPRQVEDGVR